MSDKHFEQFFDQTQTETSLLALFHSNNPLHTASIGISCFYVVKGRLRGCFILNPNQNNLQNCFQSTLLYKWDANYIIQYKKSSMYPFYYPFLPTYPYNHLSCYPYDLQNSNHFYSLAQEMILDQPRQKNQEVNTTYSVTSTTLQSSQLFKNMSKTASMADFGASREVGARRQKKAEKQGEIQFKVKPRAEKAIQTQRLRYVNKNFESNIINKIFSFLWNEDKSKPFVTKILKDKNKAALYYDYIRIVRKYCKRYINKEYLLDLCDYQSHHIAYRIVARYADKYSYFTMQELSQTIRKLIYIYLKDVCSLSIVTSKKMRVEIWRDHFQKSRNIFEFLFEGLSCEQYDRRMSQSYEEMYVGTKVSIDKSE